MFNKKIISNYMNKLTKSEQKVANYAIDKGFEIVNISILKIVEETKTSLATINRTFAKLGFNGLKYYKMFLFSRINYKIEENNELSFQKDHLLLSIQNTLSSLNYSLIDNVVMLLVDNSQNIMVLGEGFSYYVGKIFQSKLNKIFFDVKIFDETSYSAISNANVLVIFSASVSNKSLSKKIEIIKNINKKIKTILITANPSSKNDSVYDYVLSVALIDNFRMDNHELPSDSLVLLIMIANLIFDQIYMKNEIKYKNIIEKIHW